ncbi:hypothetical protein [Hymenobacter sp. BT491]|uniref:hypothetical protein n=1 Tax=Hymenobacter sp. BT491 TaxID=2766779 RepID=UPI00165360F9|nr:hypothetical protein [Hymenobacter sp. BT491]MBC6988984.1 hypothetical protein [Hymenobacter sp. BT491]
MATTALLENSIDAISHRVRTQSNWHITSDPQYLVRRKERIYGLSFEYAPQTTWINIEEGEEAAQGTINLLEARYQRDGTDETANYRRVGYAERDEHIQSFFTEEAAREFMKRNEHRYGPMHLYVDSAYRNHEWQAVREHLLNR